jgi:uncharacterized sulfatase
MCGGKYDGHKTGSPLPGNTPFSGHKGNYYQGGFRIPMFMHWPNGINTPQVRHQLVSTMDILPTAIDIAGGRLPEKVDGKSLIPLIENNKASIHDHLFWSGIHSATWGYLITKTTKHHGNERPFAPPAWVIIKNDYLLRFIGTYQPGLLTDYMEGKDPVVELYNIKNDPAELNNIAKDKPETVHEMAKIYFGESKDFPSPISWKKEKWQELVGSKTFFK